MVENKLYHLSKYILNESNFNKSLNIEPTIQYQENKLKQSKETHTEKSKEKVDLLFWCVYEIFFEKVDDHLNSNKLKLEKDIKIQLIEKLKYKGTRIKSENVQHNLLNESFLSYESLHLICIMYQSRICIYNDEIILTLGLDGPVYYIRDFKITEQPTKELYEIKHIYKPIKAVSGYKLDELKQIAIQLNIEISNKQKMYDCIFDKIITFIKYSN
jgi:hypothetical protein